MHLDDARQLALGHCHTLESERILLDRAMGRVLAAGIQAERDVPALPRSRFDGYAVRSGDLAGASPGSPVTLKVRSLSIVAGHDADVEVRRGECVRIIDRKSVV